MSAESLRALVGILKRSAVPEGIEPTDGELLRRFSHGRDEDAFARLVGRHGALVFGVCRRILGDHHHAEDAFQACFLILADRAGHLVGASSVAGWLHQVAIRVGRKARTRLARAARRDRESSALRSELIQPPESIGLDEEINRLPTVYRDALTLCYLQARSLDESAALLGCSADALRGRVHRAKQMLRDRLGRESPALSPIAIPAGLIDSTTAALSAPGATALSLARGVIGSMFLTRLIWPLVVAGILAVGVPVALLAGDGPTTPTRAKKSTTTSDDAEPPTKQAEIVGAWITDGPQKSSDLTITFTKDGKLIYDDGSGRLEHGSYRIDSKKKPPQIDLITPARANPANKLPPLLGIYQIEGDTLTLYLSEKKRPTKYEAPDGSGIMEVTHRRAKQPKPEDMVPKGEKKTDSGRGTRDESPSSEKKTDRSVKSDDPEPPPAIKIREVKVKEPPLGFATQAGTAFECVDTDKRLLPVLKEVENQLKREILVLVAYETGGPPFGTLKYRIDPKKREVEFYCQEPKLGPKEARDGGLKRVVEFFAVPVGTKIKWGGLKK